MKISAADVELWHLRQPDPAWLRCWYAARGESPLVRAVAEPGRARQRSRAGELLNQAINARGGVKIRQGQHNTLVLLQMKIRDGASLREALASMLDGYGDDRRRADCARWLRRLGGGS